MRRSEGKKERGRVKAVMRDGKFAERREETLSSLSAGLGEIRVVEAEIGGWGQGCHSNVPDGQAVSSLGWGGWGVGAAMWGCQGAWQVETQRPVTGGEHGSVREDRSEGDGGGRGVRPV